MRDTMPNDTVGIRNQLEHGAVVSMLTARLFP
jgi:hypothetical protein